MVCEAGCGHVSHARLHSPPILPRRSVSAVWRHPKAVSSSSYAIALSVFVFCFAPRCRRPSTACVPLASSLVPALCSPPPAALPVALPPAPRGRRSACVNSVRVGRGRSVATWDVALRPSSFHYNIYDIYEIVYSVRGRQTRQQIPQPHVYLRVLPPMTSKR